MKTIFSQSGPREHEIIATLHSSTLILSGQFHVRLPVRAREIARDAIPLEQNSRYDGTYWLGLLKSCIILSRRPILLEIGSCADDLTGIFGIIGFHRSGPIHVRNVSRQNLFRLASFSITWTGMDGLFYEIALAPCNLEHAVDTCRKWEKIINSMQCYYGPHNLPIIIQERVKYHPSTHILIRQTKHSAIEFVVTDDNRKVLTTFIRELETPLNELTFQELIEIYIAGRFHHIYDNHKRRDKDTCPILPPTRTIHCCFYNKEGDILPISEQFPHDTDYAWRWFCLARFWLVPCKENEFSLHHVIDRYQKTFQAQGFSGVGSEQPLRVKLMVDLPPKLNPN